MSAAQVKKGAVRPKKDQLTRDERRTIATAKALGLFVLFEGARAARVWRFYDTGTGNAVGWWCPHTHRYQLRGTEGSECEAPVVLLRAAGNDAAAELLERRIRPAPPATTERRTVKTAARPGSANAPASEPERKGDPRRTSLTARVTRAPAGSAVTVTSDETGATLYATTAPDDFAAVNAAAKAVGALGLPVVVLVVLVPPETEEAFRESNAPVVRATRGALLKAAAYRVRTG